MALIDLGEPDRYEPGPQPLLGRTPVPMRLRINATVAAVVILAAGGLAGAAPATVALPHLNRVGRLTEQLDIVRGDIVLSMTEDESDLSAYSMDGSGELWRLPLTNRVNEVIRVGDVFVLSQYELAEAGIAQASQMQIFNTSIISVNARTGQELWRLDGAAVSGLEAPIAAVDLRREGQAGALVGVSTATGREVWRREVTAGADIVAVGRAGPADGERPAQELLVVDTSGLVTPVRVESGATGSSWRIEPGAPIAFAWEDLLVRQIAGMDGTGEVIVYQRGRQQPLWRRPARVNNDGLWPCERWFCQNNSTGSHRLDPYTGNPAGDSPNLIEEPASDEQFRMAAALGKWEPIGQRQGRVLVRLDPSWTADAKTWVGVVVPDGKTYHVHPLMALGGRSNICAVTEEWLYCNGSAVVDAVSVRLSELDALLAEAGGPA